MTGKRSLVIWAHGSKQALFYSFLCGISFFSGSCFSAYCKPAYQFTLHAYISAKVEAIYHILLWLEVCFRFMFCPRLITLRDFTYPLWRKEEIVLEFFSQRDFVCWMKIGYQTQQYKKKKTDWNIILLHTDAESSWTDRWKTYRNSITLLAIWRQ